MAESTVVARQDPELDPERVLELVERAAQTDGFAALNEAASLRLRHHDPHTRHLIREVDGELIGYGQLSGAPGAVAEASLVVRPDSRRRGLGTELLTEMLAASGRRLEIWAVQATAAAAALALRTGLVAVRELLIMRRPLTGLEPPRPPEGIEIRAFRPGHDEHAWLAVNARAFASHPEQGSLQLADLEQRMAEPWFDPAGFLLATRGDEVVGFHWTKQHPDEVGEVYVLGVAPDAGVKGLGRALLAAGLSRLAELGNREVLLYVDAENVRAVDLYRRAGFGVASADVMYAAATDASPAMATMHVSSAPRSAPGVA